MAEAAKHVKRKALSIRDRRFLALYFQHHGNGTRAALAFARELGQEISEDTASVRASQYLSRIRKSDEFQAKLDEAGLDDLAIITKARELMDAKKPILDFKTGDVLGEAIDGQTQIRALELVTGWRGRTPKQVVALEEDLPEIVFEVQAEGRAE